MKFWVPPFFVPKVGCLGVLINPTWWTIWLGIVTFELALFLTIVWPLQLCVWLANRNKPKPPEPKREPMPYQPKPPTLHRTPRTPRLNPPTTIINNVNYEAPRPTPLVRCSYCAALVPQVMRCAHCGAPL